MVNFALLKEIIGYTFVDAQEAYSISVCGDVSQNQYHSTSPNHCMFEAYLDDALREGFVFGI